MFKTLYMLFFADVTHVTKNNFNYHKKEHSRYLKASLAFAIFSIFGSSIYIAQQLPLGFDVISLVYNLDQEATTQAIYYTLGVGILLAIILELTTYGSGVAFVRELTRAYGTNLMKGIYLTIFIIMSFLQVFTFSMSVKLMYQAQQFDRSLALLYKAKKDEFANINKDIQIQANLITAYKNGTKKPDPALLRRKGANPKALKMAQNEYNIALKQYKEAKAQYAEFTANFPADWITKRKSAYAKLVAPFKDKLDSAKEYLTTLLTTSSDMTLSELIEVMTKQKNSLLALRDKKQEELNTLKVRINTTKKEIDKRFDIQYMFYARLAGLILLMLQIANNIAMAENKRRYLSIYDRAVNKTKKNIGETSEDFSETPNSPLDQGGKLDQETKLDQVAQMPTRPTLDQETKSIDQAVLDQGGKLYQVNLDQVNLDQETKLDRPSNINLDQETKSIDQALNDFGLNKFFAHKYSEYEQKFIDFYKQNSKLPSLEECKTLWGVTSKTKLNDIRRYLRDEVKLYIQEGTKLTPTKKLQEVA